MPVKTTRSRVVAARIGALLLSAAVLALAPVAAADATVGSVPAVVADYAADPHGLLSRLDDLFGRGANGKGLDLTGATVGELDRAFGWREDFLAGKTAPTPITLANEWTTTISVGDKPVGVATVFINPDDDAPDLADFTPDAALGAVFAALPADGSLIHDADHGAWFMLSGTALDALVPGDSGVAKSTTLADYQRRLVAEAGKTPPASGPNQGTINSTIVIVVAVLGVGVLVFFAGRRRRASESAPGDAVAASAPPVPAGSQAPTADAPATVSARTPPAKKKAPTKRAASSAAAGELPTSSPAPLGETTKTSLPSASTPDAPRAEPPAAKKPAAKKPAAKDPATPAGSAKRLAAKPGAAKAGPPKAAPTKPGSTRPGPTKPGPTKPSGPKPTADD